MEKEWKAQRNGWWQRLWNRYKNQKIRDKILLANIGGVLILVLLLGVMGYGISRKLLVSQAIKNSQTLMEQLSGNFNYAVKSMEDMVLMQTFNKEFSNMVRADASTDYTEKEWYDKRRAVTNYSYNLINFNKYIRTVIIQDPNGLVYYISADNQGMEEGARDRCLAYEEDTPNGLPDTIGTGSYEAFFEKACYLKAEYEAYLLVTIWGSHWEKAYFSRGIENFLYDLAAEPDWCSRILQLIIRKNLVMLENWLKEQYGRKLAFYGGISTQRTLPFGTPEEVEAETRQVVEAMSKGGGFITAPSQEIQGDVPYENLCVLIRTAAEYAG